ncbi:MAG: hypothetical protein MZU95_00535 [Desulfomicrobium escambiense]|nr:hypothetical protein [Desulfomicrobium escambiense]
MKLKIGDLLGSGLRRMRRRDPRYAREAARRSPARPTSYFWPVATGLQVQRRARDEGRACSTSRFTTAAVRNSENEEIAKLLRAKSEGHDRPRRLRPARRCARAREPV